MHKKQVNYRLSESTFYLIEDSLAMLRESDIADGATCLANRRTRTDVIEKAVAYFCDYLRKRLELAKQGITPTPGASKKRKAKP